MSDRLDLSIPWSAVTFQRLAAQGTLRPAFFQCCRAEDPAYPFDLTYRSLLVKSIDSPERLCREVFGNIVARHFGLATPTPGLVTISLDVALHANAELRRQGKYGNVVPGTMAGCHWVALGSNVLIGDELTASYPLEALRLFMFDMVAQNADRVETNPNCSETLNGLMVFDFEQCFVLDDRLMEPGPAWKPASRGLSRHHMFFRTLKGRGFSREVLGAGLDRLNLADLRSYQKYLPSGWRSESDRIIDHLDRVLNHRMEFLVDIEEALK